MTSSNTRLRRQGASRNYVIRGGWGGEGSDLQRRARVMDFERKKPRDASYHYKSCFLFLKIQSSDHCLRDILLLETCTLP